MNSSIASDKKTTASPYTLSTPTSSLTFSKSPSTILSLLPSNSSISHVTLTYLPANHSLLTAVSQTIASPASSGVSLRILTICSGIADANSVITAPGWMENDSSPWSPYSVLRNSLKRMTASFVI